MSAAATLTPARTAVPTLGSCKLNSVSAMTTKTVRDTTQPLIRILTSPLPVRFIPVSSDDVAHTLMTDLAASN